MISPQEHLDQAVRNEEFSVAISSLPNRFAEWEITVLFYSALHYADALLTTLGFNAKDHRQRRNLIVRHTTFPNEYDNLFQASLEARYDLVQFTIVQVDQMRQTDLSFIKEEVLLHFVRSDN